MIEVKESEYQDMLASGSGGFCTYCHEESTSVDVTAQRQNCRACGYPFVYGIEALIAEGIAEVVDDGDTE